MHHPFAGRHPVNGPGLYFHLAADAVAVHNGALKQVGEGGKPDMGVWQNVQVFVCCQGGWPHVVEENKRAYRPFLPEGEQPAHLKTSDTGGPFRDNHFND
ncbi:hypothetical protein DSECCO2_612330 [anaerobic digester metagenome]